MKKVAIIGSNSLSDNKLEILRNKGIQIVDLEEQNKESLIRIGTSIYKEVLDNQVFTVKSKLIQPYFDMYEDSNYTRKLPESIDLVKEFELIQLKKSKLSKWERDMVIKMFNKKYQLI